MAANESVGQFLCEMLDVLPTTLVLRLTSTYLMQLRDRKKPDGVEGVAAEETGDEPSCVVAERSQPAMRVRLVHVLSTSEHWLALCRPVPWVPPDGAKRATAYPASAILIREVMACAQHSARDVRIFGARTLRQVCLPVLFCSGALFRWQKVSAVGARCS